MIETSSAHTRDRAVTVAVYFDAIDEREINEDLAELERLADTAGAEVVHSITQRRSGPDLAFYIGKGKLQELKDLLTLENIGLVIFNNQLSPLQQRNIEKFLDVRVIDRTALILIIFAQRARTREGKLQVELAQMQYRLPRLTGKGIELSRLGGDTGTRGGPGETKLEYDRRRIRKQIGKLQAELEKIQLQRRLHSVPRHEVPVMTAALVGYTNAGKSTLFNKLTGADVLAEDKLFATLDPTLRRLRLPNEQTIVVSDTVGFIRNLPHSLIASFRATLEEVVDADLLLHVIDATNPYSEHQSDAVYEVLEELGAAGKPTITVLNKIDLLDVRQRDEAQQLADRSKKTVALSAATEEGFDDLFDEIIEILNERLVVVEIFLPYDRQDILSFVYDAGRVIEKRYEETMVYLRAELDSVAAERIRDFVVSNVKLV